MHLGNGGSSQSAVHNDIYSRIFIFIKDIAILLISSDIAKVKRYACETELIRAILRLESKRANVATLNL